MVSVVLDSAKRERERERKQGTQSTCDPPGIGIRQPTSPLEGSISAPLENTSQPGLWSSLMMGSQLGTEPIPELSLSFPALKHKSFSSVCSHQCPRPLNSLSSYLSTAVASVVDCRERETEASGTAQSQEVAETPQKG